MANPVGFEGATFTFVAPEGQEDTVRDLHVARYSDCIISCWRLTDAELELVRETGVIWLQVMGTGTPPVYVSGLPLVNRTDGKPVHVEPFLERTPMQQKGTKA